MDLEGETDDLAGAGLRVQAVDVLRDHRHAEGGQRLVPGVGQGDPEAAEAHHRAEQ